MPGTLIVVPTPIGNLEDITLRALRVLRDVNVIAAEDTRHTGKLLAHFGISTPTVSFHEHNTRTRVPQLLARLATDESVALVTDAGTPGLSDPGLELIAACIREGIPVDPLPGASAPLVAAIGSGVPLLPLTIYGFAPSRAKDRTRWLQELAAIPGTVTFFESPHRIAATLAEAGTILGDRPMVVGRELTKLHQEFIRGTATSVFGQLTTTKGEFTLVIGPAGSGETVGEPATDEEAVAEFGRITESGAVSRRDALTKVAKKFARPAREVYAAVERAKKCGV